MTKNTPPSAAGRARPRRRVVIAAVVAVLLVGAGWGLRSTPPSAPPSAPAPVVAAVSPPAAPAAAAPETPAVPAPEATPPRTAADEAAPVEPAPVPVVQAPPTPPAAPQPPPLTSVQVAERPVHEVPPDKNPPRPDSTALDMTHPPPGAAGQRPSEGSTRAAPKQFSGAAKVTGATSITVGAIPVQLFGVKPPLAGDRCELGGVAMGCLDLAKRRLGERLGASDQVNCRTPNPQPGMVVAFAICLDARGIDLGSYLLNEGLALADTGQSYDYVGAEGVAHTLKHGLWKFR